MSDISRSFIVDEVNQLRKMSYKVVLHYIAKTYVETITYGCKCWGNALQIARVMQSDYFFFK